MSRKTILLIIIIATLFMVVFSFFMDKANKESLEKVAPVTTKASHK